MKSMREAENEFKFYEYKGNHYKLIRRVRMKCPVTRKWIDAVMYAPWYRREVRYIRERKDFHEKFKGFDPVDISNVKDSYEHV